MIDGKYHFEGRDKNGRKIIIDISRECGGACYEVMALYTNGNEIASGIYYNLDAAERAYNNMITLYALRDDENPPLKGKYATLRDDLRAALKIAEEAAAAVEDSGTCNMDAAAIRLPRWRESLVEQAAEEAGTGCFKWESFAHRRTSLQARDRGGGNDKGACAARLRHIQLSADGLKEGLYHVDGRTGRQHLYGLPYQSRPLAAGLSDL